MNKNSIQRFISHLKVTEKVKNQEDFALSIGYKSKSAFSQAISKEPISQETINKINNVYPEFKTWEISVISSDDVSKYIFDKQTIEGKLKMIFETTVKNNIELTERIEDLENKLRVSQLVNRTYLRSLIVSNKIKKEDIDSAQNLEINLDQKKQSSN